MQQRPRGFKVSTLACNMQGGETSVVLDVHEGAPFEECLDAHLVSARGGQVQCRAPLESSRVHRWSDKLLFVVHHRYRCSSGHETLRGSLLCVAALLLLCLVLFHEGLRHAPRLRVHSRVKVEQLVDLLLISLFRRRAEFLVRLSMLLPPAVPRRSTFLEFLRVIPLPEEVWAVPLLEEIPHFTRVQVANGSLIASRHGIHGRRGSCRGFLTGHRRTIHLGSIDLEYLERLRYQSAPLILNLCTDQGRKEGLLRL
mmetsp:Transcript_9792/g.27340  ORF Transcript_9792/g.27340 Transcript_9792/m.27340 type:complete len:255 (-) Transcript_9792:145-909(-)